MKKRKGLSEKERKSVKAEFGKRDISKTLKEFCKKNLRVNE